MHINFIEMRPLLICKKIHLKNKLHCTFCEFLVSITELISSMYAFLIVSLFFLFVKDLLVVLCFFLVCMFSGLSFSTFPICGLFYLVLLASTFSR